MHACLIVFGVAISLSSDPTTPVLLDEISAGCEANLVRIQHGRASYSVTGTRELPSNRDKDGRATAGIDYKGTIWFTPTHIRWDVNDSPGEVRCLRDQKSDTFYIVRPKDLAPPHHVAIVDEIGNMRYLAFRFHPAALGHSPWVHKRFTLVDLIKFARGNPDKCILRAKREGTAILLEASYPKENARDEYRVDTKQGYGITGYKQWALKSPSAPGTELETEYTDVGSGVYVAKRHVTIERVVIKGQYRETSRTVTTLVECDLTHEPEPKRFTLADFDLPKGARVADNRTGKTYMWGLDAVREWQVDAAVADMVAHGDSSTYLRSKWRNVWRYGIPGVLAVLIAGAVVWGLSRRKRDRAAPTAV